MTDFQFDVGMRTAVHRTTVACHVSLDVLLRRMIVAVRTEDKGLHMSTSNVNANTISEWKGECVFLVFK